MFHNRSALLVAVVFLLATMLASCSGGQPVSVGQSQSGGGEEIVLIDSLSREVRLAQPAQRIVSITPANTEILFAIGAGEQVVGRDQFSDTPAEVSEIAEVGGGWGDLNTEAMVALEPDLVLAGDLYTPEQIQGLQDLGLTTFVVGNPDDFEGLFSNIEIVGALTGHGAEAEAFVAGLRQRVQDAVDRLQDLAAAPVYFEVDGSDPQAPWTAGRGTFQDYLITMAGGSNIADVDGWAQINLESILALDPAVMIFVTGPYVQTTVQSIAERPGWASLRAVADGAVYSIDTNLTDRPGPRLVDALEAMARMIHPEAFTE
jgi:iron complex transport system substrate-binding protein